MTDQPSPYWHTDETVLFQGDCVGVMDNFEPELFDVIFADPPYFLSKGGTTNKGGKRTCVDVGGWDKIESVEQMHAFNRLWLNACRRVLKPNGTIWVTGTIHSIHSVGFAMQQLEYRVLNEIVWEKPNPPPNLGCRCFTHATESVLWASKGADAKHYFDYAAMKAVTGKQMKSVWCMTAPGKSEKVHGKHPTQKPVELLHRILMASCPYGGTVLDPFNGSGTTGVVAKSLGLTYVGIDRDASYLDITKARLETTEKLETFDD